MGDVAVEGIAAASAFVLQRLIAVQQRVFARWKKAKIAALILVVMIALSQAFADTSSNLSGSASSMTGAAGMESSAQTVEYLIKDVGSVFSDAHKNPELKAFGKMIAFILLSMLLSWETLKVLAGGGGLGEMFAEWIPLLVAFTVAMVLMDNSFQEGLIGIVDHIGGLITGKALSTPEAALNAAITPIFEAVQSLVGIQQVTQFTTGEDGGWLGFLKNIGDNYGAYLMFLLSVFVKIIVAFLIMLAGVIMLAHIMVAFFSKYIALAFGMIMIPFLIWRTTSWIFDNWLKFTIGAGVLQIVAMLLLKAVTLLLGKMQSVSVHIAAQAQNLKLTERMAADYLQLAFLFLLAVLSVLVMAEAPRIASGLLSGGGAAGFGGLKSFTRGLGGQLANSTAKTAGRGMARMNNDAHRAAGKTAVGLGQEAMGAGKGLYDGVKGKGMDARQMMNPGAAGSRSAAGHNAYGKVFSAVSKHTNQTRTSVRTDKDALSIGSALGKVKK